MFANPLKRESLRLKSEKCEMFARRDVYLQRASLAVQ